MPGMKYNVSLNSRPHSRIGVGNCRSWSNSSSSRAAEELSAAAFGVCTLPQKLAPAVCKHVPGLIVEQPAHLWEKPRKLYMSPQAGLGTVVQPRLFRLSVQITLSVSDKSTGEQKQPRTMCGLWDEPCLWRPTGRSQAFPRLPKAPKGSAAYRRFTAPAPVATSMNPHECVVTAAQKHRA